MYLYMHIDVTSCAIQFQKLLFVPFNSETDVARQRGVSQASPFDFSAAAGTLGQVPRAAGH